MNPIFKKIAFSRTAREAYLNSIMIKKSDLSGKGYRVFTHDGKDLGELLSIWPTWKQGEKIFEQWNLGEDVEGGEKSSIIVSGDRTKGTYDDIRLQENKTITLGPNGYKEKMKTPNSPKELFEIPMSEDVQDVKANYHSLIIKKANK